jgi:hypothetical protein
MRIHHPPRYTIPCVSLILHSKCFYQRIDFILIFQECLEKQIPSCVHIEAERVIVDVEVRGI